jgi:lactose/L-arabinose transport system ATP-binding protein
VSYVHLIGPDGEKIIVEERGDHRSALGDQVDLGVDPAHLYLFDAKSELRLR